MKPFALSVAVTAVILMTSTTAQKMDFTQVAGAFGSDVVNAVVGRIRSRCIFSEDRLYLRRAAYVTSRDGADPATYRPGYNGGIWQVDESKFVTTKACSSYIASECSIIQSQFKIDWTKVTWSDLRKPLYSGLAASLYTLIQLRGTDMPGDITQQAQNWATIYGRPASDYSSIASGATTVDCSGKMDIAFILDSSGSVSYADFGLMLNFTADVVEVMNVASDVVRVADIVFSSSVKVEFDFARYVGAPAALKQHILNTYKESSGTATSLGLDKAADLLYDTTKGARTLAKKVAVLVTDGYSNSLQMTIASATALKNKGTTVFAIGVGGYNQVELDAVASQPICSHVLTLPNFSVIKSILTEIQKSACEASLVVNEDRPAKDVIPPTGSTTTTVTIAPTDTTKTIEASVKCGILDIYVSTTDPKPGPAVHEEKYRATDGSPTALSVVDTLPAGTPVYVTVVGTRLPANLAGLKNCTDYSWSLAVVPKRYVNITCTEKGVARPCTKADMVTAGLCTKDKEPDYQLDVNPCTAASIAQGIMRHPYPFDSTKFLQCDLRGNVYVTSCPNGFVFNTNSLECGFTAPGSGPAFNTGVTSSANMSGISTPPSVVGSSGSSAAQQLPSGVANPCTQQNLFNGIFYHAYSADKTKFIQCDEWGHAWLMPCGRTTQWSQSAYTCVKTPQPTPCTYPGQLLANLCDHRTFFQCDAALTPRKQSCPAGLFWNPNYKSCDFRDVQPASSCSP